MIAGRVRWSVDGAHRSGRRTARRDEAEGRGKEGEGGRSSFESWEGCGRAERKAVRTRPCLEKYEKRGEERKLRSRGRRLDEREGCPPTTTSILVRSIDTLEISC